MSAVDLGPEAADGQHRIAIRWNGTEPAELGLWFDHDRDDHPDAEERAIPPRSVAPGITVLEVSRPGASGQAAAPWLYRWRTQAPGTDGSGLSREGQGTFPAAEWSRGFNAPELTGIVMALAVFDDGSGPALYAGGDFAAIGKLVVKNIARWDGTSWTALPGSADVGVQGEVRALRVHDDGTGPALYVGGSFEAAGGEPIRNIAKWRSGAWEPLSWAPFAPHLNGTDGAVNALAAYDGGSGQELYVGGDFGETGGGCTVRIARWRSAGWAKLEPGQLCSGLSAGGLPSAPVYAMTVHDDGSGPALYIGGRFLFTSDGSTVNRIVRWNGTSFSSLSMNGQIGLDSDVASSGYVHALTSWDDGQGSALWVGGAFATAAGVVVDNLARWRNDAWSAVGSGSEVGTDGPVDVLAVDDTTTPSTLLMGGLFNGVPDLSCGGVARRVGNQWQPFGVSPNLGLDPNHFGGALVLAFANFGDGPQRRLFVGGDFRAPSSFGITNLSTWNGTDWEQVGSLDDGNGLAGPVYALAVYDDGHGPALYAGGQFLRAGSQPVTSIARWNGIDWKPLPGLQGQGVNGRVTALEVYDSGSGPKLYVGGYFFQAGGQSISYLATWNGQTWARAFGPGELQAVNGYVLALEVYDDGSGPALYAAGLFDEAGSVAASSIARWNGSSWSSLSGPSGEGLRAHSGSITIPMDMALFDPGTGLELVVGGWFRGGGGLVSPNLARWTPQGWQTIPGPQGGTGIAQQVLGLASFADVSGPGLWVGGNSFTFGGFPPKALLRWNGSQWSFPPGGPGGSGSTVKRLEAHDDGTGPALYLTGDFYLAEAEPLHHLARWDGSVWSTPPGPADSGLDASGDALLSASLSGCRALFVGSEQMEIAGGVPSAYLASWSCPTLFADGFESGDTSAWSQTVP